MYESAPAPQPRSIPTSERRGPSAIALLLAGALVGGVAGGVAGASLSPREAAPATPVPAVSAAPVASQQITIQESSAVVDAVKEILPAVVTVVNKANGTQPVGSGSGVVVDRSRGYVVTNSHVVQLPGSLQPARNFDVILSDGTKLAASPVGNDPETDVAVLKVQGNLSSQAALGDSS